MATTAGAMSSSSSWANVAAYKLNAAVLASGETGGEDEARLMQAVVQEVAKQLAAQIPSEVYDMMALELARGVRQEIKSRDSVRMAGELEGQDPEDFVALGESDDEDEELEEMMDLGLEDSAVASCFDGGEEDEELSGRLANHLKHMPSALGGWLAADLYQSLTKPAHELGSTPALPSMNSLPNSGVAVSPSDLDPNTWESSKSESASGSSTPIITITSVGSRSDTASELGSSNSSSRSNPSPGVVSVASDVSIGGRSWRTTQSNQSDSHRQFYDDNNNPAMALDAFKKFKIVLVSGHGLRVMKHNHSGGRRERVLRYNPEDDELFWATSKMLGKASISSSSIERVSREGNVVYIWYNKGKGKKTHKTAVGFEVQREYDARILELALTHLQGVVKDRLEHAQS
jgi:hypothetical protein